MLDRARRPVTGLSCRATAGAAGTSPFSFYDFPEDTPRPMLFFGDRGLGVERVVHSDATQYADFREAVLTPLDAQLPPHLLGASPAD